MTPNTIRNRFNSVLKDTENNISNYVNNPGSDMTRHRKCTFLNTITATLSFSMNKTNMGTGTPQSKLPRMCQGIS